MDRTVARRIGRNIAALRTLRGWSQKGLAARVDVTRGRLSKWEGGEHAPPVEKLMALARELEVGLDDLVSDGSGPSPDGLTPGQRELVRGALRYLSRLLPSRERAPREEESGKIGQTFRSHGGFGSLKGGVGWKGRTRPGPAPAARNLEP